MEVLKFSHNNLHGFTLAEVLITLGIIGVIAALTVPILMNSIQDTQFKVAYKKAFSVASQAWQSANADNVLEPRSGWVGSVANYNNFNQFMTKFSIVQTCVGNDQTSCWAPNTASDSGIWGGAPFNGGAQEICFIDKSGMAWCNTYSWGEIKVDTNGAKPPNQYGIDRFVLITTVHGDETYTVPGIPNSIVPVWADFTSYDASYCTSAAKHPCYYRKWLYN